MCHARADAVDGRREPSCNIAGITSAANAGAKRMRAKRMRTNLETSKRTLTRDAAVADET